MNLAPPQVRTALAATPRRSLTDPSLCPAAVLLPLLRRGGELAVLFVRRTETMRHHRGEIAFPGGGCEEDDRDVVATALRETEEELGVEPETVAVLGLLDDFVSVHDYCVTPVVGWLDEPPALRPAPAEIAEAFTLPLERLCEPSVWHKECWRHRGRLHPVHFCRVDGYEIWGLTAAILRLFLKRVGLLPPSR